MNRVVVAVAGALCAAVLSAVIPQAGQSADLQNPFAGNAAAIKEGEKIFDERCADCHGSDAMGGAGPDLTDDRWSYGGSDADVFATVSGGRKGGMPSWRGQLKDEDMWRAIAYIRSLKKQ
jgi:cytochrome c oxidase cbb3-type subunit 3